MLSERKMNRTMARARSNGCFASGPVRGKNTLLHTRGNTHNSPTPSRPSSLPPSSPQNTARRPVDTTGRRNSEAQGNDALALRPALSTARSYPCAPRHAHSCAPTPHPPCFAATNNRSSVTSAGRTRICGRGPRLEHRWSVDKDSSQLHTQWSSTSRAWRSWR